MVRKPPFRLTREEWQTLDVMLACARTHPGGIVLFTPDAEFKKAIGDAYAQFIRDADVLRHLGLFVERGPAYVLTSKGYKASQRTASA